MERDSVYIGHILEAMTAIERFIDDMSFDDLMADKKTRYAVERSFEIIGEATKNISAETKAKYADIPWQNIAGLRDKIIHHYFDVDYETLWDTAKYDIPILKQSLKGFD